MSDKTVIKLEGVFKVFETETVTTHALSNIDLQVERGEYIAVAGPSGCGKSTLLSIVGLLDTATSGTYFLDGQPVTGLSAKQRAQVRNRQIGFIFQSFNLLGDRTVAQNVELPLIYRGLSASERHKQAMRALERVGMTQRASHYPSQLSGGQQQRVAVARAVVGDPSLLLADEPTGNLDSKNGAAVMELLRELHVGGATVCLVTHDPRFAEDAGRVMRLLDGALVRDDAVSPHEAAGSGV
jgi:putative ABC transport system ATP-binding protein